MNGRPSLADLLKGCDVGAVAGRLGVSVERCLCCGAERRGSEGRRGAVGLTPNRQGWSCYRCGAKGDAAALVLAVATGKARGATADEWATARKLAADCGLVEPDGTQGDTAAAPRVVLAPVPAAPQPPPKRLPVDELHRVWASGRPVGQDEDVAAWLSAVRGLDVERIMALDLARALPASCASAGVNGDGAHPLPAWARLKLRAWSDGWRLLLPVYGATGAQVGLRARWTSKEPTKVKEAHPRGYGNSLAVYADPVGRWLLATGSAARAGELAGSDVYNPLGWRWSGRVCFTEGGVDFLTRAADLRRQPGAATAAVLGLWAGAWGPELAERLPAKVELRDELHIDDAGRRYAAKVLQTLSQSQREGWRSNRRAT